MAKNERIKSHLKILNCKFPPQRNNHNQSHQQRTFTSMRLKLNYYMINHKIVIMNKKLFHKQRDPRNKNKSRFKEILITHFQVKADLKMNLFKVLKYRNHFKNQTHLYLKSSCLENLQ
jgi:hypothetical protein